MGWWWFVMSMLDEAFILIDVEMIYEMLYTVGGSQYVWTDALWFCDCDYEAK